MFQYTAADARVTLRRSRQAAAGAGRAGRCLREDLAMNLRSIILVAALGLASARPVGAADLLVTQYKNDPSGAPYGIALEKGFFKKHGLDITGIISGAGGGSSVRNAMASDLGYGDVTAAPVIAAAEQGQDVKIVSITARSLADLVLIVMPDSPLKTAADLKGKKFGISNPKSLGEMMGVLVMEKAGLKQGDLQMTALGSLSGALTALENGVVDATSIPVILFRIRGGESKYRVLVGPKDLPLIPSQLGMATGKAIKEWPEKLRAIQAARREGTRFIYEHTDEAIQILSTLYAPLPPKDVGIMVKELAEAKFWTEGRIEMPLLEQTVHAMKGVGMLQKDVDLNKIVDSSFLPADLQK
jgi:NitT/TauT family transport system substrate-binding protein